ncbi:MAG: ABC transporter permease [Nitrospinota bacterium]|nr:MAG: ABC transporter permease [Nitrospinota bacterium]
MTRQGLEHLGGFSLLGFQAIKNSLTPPYYPSLLIAELDMMGVRSISVANLVALFTGMVMALQTSYAMALFGAKLYVGPVVALSMVRELGPVLTALLVGGRVGSGITAQLGSMKVTEQIDALRALGANYIKKLIVPKVMAALIVFPLLTILADLMGIFGGMIIAALQLDLDAIYYLNSVVRMLTFRDVFSGLGKTFVFGFLIVLIGCYFGLNTTGGTEGLGRATTSAVVAISITILIVDFFLTKLFLLL